MTFAREYLDVFLSINKIVNLCFEYTCLVFRRAGLGAGNLSDDPRSKLKENLVYDIPIETVMMPKKLKLIFVVIISITI